MHDLVVRDLEQARKRWTRSTTRSSTPAPSARRCRCCGGVVVASQPYDDDPGWADVPDHHLVDVADGVVTVTELEA
jgi:predicted glutamine amidotransferase